MRGVKEAKKMITDGIGKNFIVYFDPDVDGAFAGVLPVGVLKRFGEYPLSLMNKNRMHGALIDLSPYAGKYNTVISVDSHVPLEKVKEIVDLGFNFVSIDHHECGDEFIRYYNTENKCRGLVINNQYPFENPEKRYLSGAGVVYEVFKEMFPDEDFDWFRDIVGITLLSDVRDISSEDAKVYLKYTYTSSKRNGYISYLIRECSVYKSLYSFGFPSMDRSYINFVLSPTINALLRFNKTNVVLNFVLGKGLKEFMNDKQKQLLEDTIKDHIQIKKVGSAAIVKVEDWREDVVMSNFIGLIANRLLGRVATHILCFVVNKDGSSRASFRSVKSEFNFLKEFNDAGYKAIGHKSAFGVLDFVESKIPVNKVAEIVDKSCKVNFKRKYIEVSNLAIFRGTGKAKKVAEDNEYLPDKDRVLIQYVGNNIKLEKSANKYKKYMIDGVPVMQFNELDKSMAGCLIDVSSSSGLLNFIFTSYKVND